MKPLVQFICGAFLCLLNSGAMAALSLAPVMQDGVWPPFPTGTPRSVDVIGQYAYVTMWRSGLAVFDISNPSNIVQVGSVPTSNSAFEIVVTNGPLT
jgi:hypothetical protein